MVNLFHLSDLHILFLNLGGPPVTRTYLGAQAIYTILYLNLSRESATILTLTLIKSISRQNMLAKISLTLPLFTYIYTECGINTVTKKKVHNS